jgi:hypothetical protein
MINIKLLQIRSRCVIVQRMTLDSTTDELSHGLHRLQQLILQLENSLKDSYRHRELIARLRQEADIVRRLFEKTHHPVSI